MSSAKPVVETVHPLLAALERAPVGAPFAPEQRGELDRTMADIEAGRMQLVDHDDVPAWLEQRARDLGELDE